MPSSSSSIRPRSEGFRSSRPELGSRAGRFVPLLVALLVAGASGCKKDRIEVIADDGGADFGRDELLAAVKEAGKHPDSADAYRDLAETVARLGPRFSEPVSRMAERNLAFLALGPLEAHAGEPIEQQVSALALTVWPTAFEIEPKKGETPAAFVERLCGDELATECKYVIPEYRPLVLSARAWRQMADRAREAFAKCRFCNDRPTYEEILDQYERHADDLAARLAKLKGHIDHGAWPEAGDHAQPFGGAPLLALTPDGEAWFRGEKVSDWRRAIAAKRGKKRILAVHLWPEDRIQVLRSLLGDAARAGYRQVVLQVRQRHYPFKAMEYHLAVEESGGAAVEVRDVDTIQVLVQGLEAAADRAGSHAAFALSH